MPYANWSRPEEYDFAYLPGHDVRLRPVQPEDLILSGALQYLDTLTSFVQEEHVDPAHSRSRIPQDHRPKQLTQKQRQEEDARLAKEQKEEEDRKTTEMLKKFSDNPDDFENLLYLIDAVLVAGCVIPAMTSGYTTDSHADRFTKIALADREDGHVYPDYIPFSDRMSVFNELTKGLKPTKSVLEESAEHMAALEAVPSDEHPAE
jgi:hypothetical protein